MAVLQKKSSWRAPDGAHLALDFVVGVYLAVLCRDSSNTSSPE